MRLSNFTSETRTKTQMLLTLNIIFQVMLSVAAQKNLLSLVIKLSGCLGMGHSLWPVALSAQFFKQ